MSVATPWPYTSTRQPPRPARPVTDGLGLRTRRCRGADGSVHEVVYIGPFARLLDKSTATIRRWEREGVLPASPFEQVLRAGPARRLYPVAWVVGVLRIAEDEGLVGRKPACIDATDFTARTRDLHRELFG